MNFTRVPCRAAAVLAGLAISLVAPALAAAQPAPPPPVTGPAKPADDVNPEGWTAKAGLSYVQTAGNSETTTLGFKLGAVHNWTRTYFTFQAGGVRVSVMATPRKRCVRLPGITRRCCSLPVCSTRRCSPRPFFQFPPRTRSVRASASSRA